MLVFLLLVVVLLAGVSAESTAERKLVINGDTVLPSDNQFFVRSWLDTVRETDDVLCGASLIHSDMIITAAHCHGGFNFGAMAYDPNSESFSQYRQVDLQIAYKKYYENLEIINYDILVLRLESPITDVEPILLNSDPNFPITRNNFGIEGTVVEATGVGITETGFISKGLEVGYFSPMSNFQCAQRLGKANVEMTPDVMCADPYTDDSICAGDSGGPLIARVPAFGEVSAASRSPWVMIPNLYSSVSPHLGTIVWSMRFQTALRESVTLTTGLTNKSATIHESHLRIVWNIFNLINTPSFWHRQTLRISWMTRFG